MHGRLLFFFARLRPPLIGAMSSSKPMVIFMSAFFWRRRGTVLLWWRSRKRRDEKFAILTPCRVFRNRVEWMVLASAIYDFSLLLGLCVRRERKSKCIPASDQSEIWHASHGHTSFTSIKVMTKKCVNAKCPVKRPGLSEAARARERTKES